MKEEQEVHIKEENGNDSGTGNGEGSGAVNQSSTSDLTDVASPTAVSSVEISTAQIEGDTSHAANEISNCLNILFLRHSLLLPQVFIGGLPRNITEAELREALDAAGSKSLVPPIVSV